MPHFGQSPGWSLHAPRGASGRSRACPAPAVGGGRRARGADWAAAWRQVPGVRTCRPAASGVVARGGSGARGGGGHGGPPEGSFTPADATLRPGPLHRRVVARPRRRTCTGSPGTRGACTCRTRRRARARSGLAGAVDPHRGVPGGDPQRRRGLARRGRPSSVDPAQDVRVLAPQAGQEPRRRTRTPRRAAPPSSAGVRASVAGAPPRPATPAVARGAAWSSAARRSTRKNHATTLRRGRAASGVAREGLHVGASGARPRRRPRCRQAPRRKARKRACSPRTSFSVSAACRPATRRGSSAVPPWLRARRGRRRGRRGAAVRRRARGRRAGRRRRGRDGSTPSRARSAGSAGRRRVPRRGAYQPGSS